MNVVILDQVKKNYGGKKIITNSNKDHAQLLKEAFIALEKYNVNQIFK